MYLRTSPSPAYPFLFHVPRSTRWISAGCAEDLSTTPPSPPPVDSVVQFTSSKLLKCYFDNGLIECARDLFDGMSDRGVVAWTTMISGYTSSGRHSEAWGMFRAMVGEGVQPNAFTLSSALLACQGLGSLECGKTVHATAVKRGLVGQTYVGNLLVNMYAACDRENMGDARKVFEGIADKTEVTWTMIITGYTRSSDGHEGIRVFRRMIQEGIQLNPYTCSIAIRACASTGSLSFGRQIHCSVVKSMFGMNVPVGNSLVDMYCRCMSLLEAKQYFNEMLVKDLITWNTIIGGLSRGSPREAFQLLINMGSQNLQPNNITFCSIIAACSSLAMLNCGQQVHGTIIRRGLMVNLLVANALIDMYAKCGSVPSSRRMFDEISPKDLVSWTSMLNGYGAHGYAKEAIELFDEMVASGITIDHIVFVGVLSACSHAGLVEEGLKYFNRMFSDFGVAPSQQVYGCLVDLLGRAGRVEEAYELIKTMPFEPEESVWGALLGACRMHKKVDLGKLAANKILRLKPSGAKTYVMLSNIYAAGGEWDEFARMRRMMRGTGSRKEVGRSWIEVNDGVHSFSVEDRCNSQERLVYDALDMLLQHMGDEECVPDWIFPC